MRGRALRYRLEHLAYRRVERSILARRHEDVERLGRRLGRLAFHVDRPRRRLALRNLRRVFPDWAEADRRSVVRACFEEFGATFLEGVSAARFDRREIEERFELVGEEILLDLAREERGFFLLSGHFGRWELASYPLGLLLGGLDLVARPPNNPLVAAELVPIRERFGNRLIEKRGAAHRILNAIRRGGVVGAVIDQRVRPNQGIKVPFLGHPAWTSPIIASISLRTGAPVVPIFSFPLGAGRYRVETRQPITPGAERGPAAEAALTTRYGDAIAREIAVRPELWLWMHRRWEEA